jgi:hypothetical protein
MQFDEFVREIDAAVRAGATVETFEGPQANHAHWKTRARNAAVALVEPRNVSVTLAGSAEAPETTWYPIDAALVPVVSRRIAAYLGEA